MKGMNSDMKYNNRMDRSKGVDSSKYTCMFSYFQYLLSPNVRVLGERRTKSRSKGDKGLKYREGRRRMRRGRGRGRRRRRDGGAGYAIA